MSTTFNDLEEGSVQKDELKKWNWGGFLWSWVWALGHRLWWQGIVALLVNLVLPIVAGVYFGLKGNELAWERGSYASKEELRQKERAWVKAWFILVGVGLALVLVFVLAA